MNEGRRPASTSDFRASFTSRTVCSYLGGLLVVMSSFSGITVTRYLNFGIFDFDVRDSARVKFPFIQLS